MKYDIKLGGHGKIKLNWMAMMILSVKFVSLNKINLILLSCVKNQDSDKKRKKV